MANLGDVLRQVVCTPKHIPDDWAFLKLTDVCSPKQWKTISSVEMTATGYPVFGANGFVGFYPEYNHADETVAITCRGNTCGTINRIPPKTYITGNSMALDDIKNNVVLQEYLYYALKYRGVGDSVSGSAQPQITGAGLRSIEFPAPPLPEQQKIATILSSIDDVIGKTRAQIDKLKDLKTGMMQELLTKGIGHTEFKDSPVGRIPVEWEIIELSGVVSKERPVTYGIVQTGVDISAGVPCVRVVDLMKQVLSTEKMIHTSEKISQQYKRTILQEGDIMFALRGEIGHVCKVEPSLVGANLTRGVALIAPNKKVSTSYLLWALRSPGVRQTILDGVSGSALQEISLGNLRTVKIPVPPKPEQAALARAMDSIAQALIKNRTKLEIFKQLKKALMQDLLTGKVRVNITDKESAAS